MEWYHNIISWLIKRRVNQINFFTRHPMEVQGEWFSKLIDKGIKTAYGAQHGFASISGIDDYKKAVPVNQYKDLWPFIERMMQGETKVLWPTEISWFAKSSGTTTGRSKFIPVSKEALENCHYKGGKDLLAIYFTAHPDSRIFDGKSLVMGGSSEINQFSANSYYGDLSAILIQHLPYWINLVQTPDRSVSLHPDWEHKLNKMAEITSKQNVTNISGVPSWNLLLLNKVLEFSGKKTIREVWPNLELYAHGGVRFDNYRSSFEDVIGNPGITYLQTYNASEGFFGIQDRFETGTNDMLLMLDYGVFYEFMPLEEVNKPNPQTIQLDQVEVGQHYAPVITTNAGLWRYMIGDTIEFTELFPFRFRVSGRTKYCINLCGEELMEHNVADALKQCSEKLNCQIKEYVVGPVFPKANGKAGHEWVIEFSQSPESMEAFTSTLDSALQKLNSDYEAKRTDDLLLQPPIVNVVAKGTFYNWMRSQGKIGGQNKVPLLSMTREHVEGILAFGNKK